MSIMKDLDKQKKERINELENTSLEKKILRRQKEWKNQK